MAYVVSMYMILECPPKRTSASTPKQVWPPSRGWLPAERVPTPFMAATLVGWLAQPSVLIENVRGRTLNNGGRKGKVKSPSILLPWESKVSVWAKNKGGDDVDLRTKTPPKKRDVPRLLKHQCHLCKCRNRPPASLRLFLRAVFAVRQRLFDLHTKRVGNLNWKRLRPPGRPLVSHRSKFNYTLGCVKLLLAQWQALKKDPHKPE